MKRYMVWVSLAVGSSSLTSCNGNSAPAPAVQSPAAVKPVAAGTAPATATTVKPVATDKTAANRNAAVVATRRQAPAATDAASNPAPTISLRPASAKAAAIEGATDAVKRSLPRLDEIGSAAVESLTRVNPFKPPKLDAASNPVADRRDENKAVRLIGFVDRGKSKAILSFDGQLQTLASGDVYNGVEIVSIAPPDVTLRTGQRQWTTTLFDQPIVNTKSMSGAATAATPEVTIGQSGGDGYRVPPGFERLFPAGSVPLGPPPAFAAPRPPSLRPAPTVLPPSPLPGTRTKDE